MGLCGKTGEVANLQDLLVFILKSVAVYAEKAQELSLLLEPEMENVVLDGLFMTITNVNFDPQPIEHQIKKALALREKIKARVVMFTPTAKCSRRIIIRPSKNTIILSATTAIPGGIKRKNLKNFTARF